MKCIWCTQETNLPIAHLGDHFKPYSPGAFRYLRGNIAMAGRWGGFWSTAYLASPLLNSLRHWRYRAATLDFGSDPMVLHALVIAGNKQEAAHGINPLSGDMGAKK